MSVPTLPTVDPNATLEELRNQVAILQKTITFYLTSNLSSDNAYEFGGWLVGEDSLMSIDGSVGLSSAITGADDIRIWAGNSVIGSSPFRVYESGHVYASNLTMVGGSIDWTGVVKPTYGALEVGAVPNTSTDVYNTLTNFGAKRGLFIDAGTGNLYINADDIRAGNIVGIHIQTASSGSRVELFQNQLQTYNSSNQLEGMVLGYNPGGGSSYGDVSFFSQGVRAMTIYNTISDGFRIQPENAKSLFLGAASRNTFADGNWNFINANVSNLNVVAKFG